MKKLLPKRQDLVMFIISFLPALMALLDYASTKFGLFFIAELVYLFDMFCFPIVIFLIAVITSAYRSTLFCGGCAYVSWAGVYLLMNLFPDSYDVSMFGWEHVVDHAKDFLLMTLVALGARGIISLIIWIIRKIRRSRNPEANTDFKIPAVNIVLIVLCACDFAIFVISWVTWRGVHTNDSILSLLVFVAAALAAFILEFLITLLPKSYKFARKLTIVFNAVFLAAFYFTMFIYEILPVRYDMGGSAVSLGAALLPIVHVAVAFLILLIRKQNKKQ